MYTSDLEADYLRLQSDGVDIVGPPATVMLDDDRGTRFFCFRDPDGTFLELVEVFVSER